MEWQNRLTSREEYIVAVSLDRVDERLFSVESF